MRKFSLTLGRFDGDGFSSAISNSKHRTRRFFLLRLNSGGPQFIANRFGTTTNFLLESTGELPLFATGVGVLGPLRWRRKRMAVLGG